MIQIKENAYFCVMNPVSARLLGQQLICPQFSAPHEVVRHMGAMQAQDYRMMQWAAAMRTKVPSAKAFASDYNAGRIVRVHLFRTTWQLVAGEDWAWMLELYREKALRLLAGWMKSNGVSIPPSEQESVQRIFSDCLSTCRIARKEDLDAALRECGIVMDSHRLSYHLHLAEYAGLLCSGDLLPARHSYALAADKLPKTSPLLHEEALALLARKYFSSHGPATLEDFVWWSGLNVSECRKGMDALGTELVRQCWKDLTFYCHETGRSRGFRRGGVILLPSFDEYLIGYKSRHIALAPEYRHRAHNNSGIFWPVVLIDGQVAGNWTIKGGRVQTDFFSTDTTADPASLQAEMGRFQDFAVASCV